MGHITQPIAYPLARSPSFGLGGRTYSETLTFTIADSADDGHEQEGVNNWIPNPTSPVTGFLVFGLFTNPYHIGLRFPATGIAQGTQIKSARIELNQRRTFNQPSGIWYGVDVDNFAGFDAVSNYPSNLTQTTANSPFIAAPDGTLRIIQHDVTAQAQEIINRASFGGTLAFIALNTTGGNAFDNAEDLSYASGADQARLVVVI